VIKQLGCTDTDHPVMLISPRDRDKMKNLPGFKSSGYNDGCDVGTISGIWQTPMDVYTSADNCNIGEIVIEYNGRKSEKMLWNDKVDA